MMNGISGQQFCYAMIRYLFPAQPITKSQTDGVNDENESRILFHTSVDGYPIYLKITADQPSYDYEYKIYHQLNNYLAAKLIPNGVLEIYSGNNRFSYHEAEGDKPAHFAFPYIKIEDWNHVLKIYSYDNHFQDIMDFWTKNQGKVLFIATKHDANYSTLGTVLKNQVHRSPDQKNKLFVNCVSLLVGLNRSIGFCHLDLHIDNLLVHNTYFDQFKLYDFDLSRTDRYPNSEAFRNNYVPNLSQVYDGVFTNFGLAFDVMRLMINLTIRPLSKSSDDVFSSRFVDVYNQMVMIKEIYFSIILHHIYQSRQILDGNIIVYILNFNLDFPVEAYAEDQFIDKNTEYVIGFSGADKDYYKNKLKHLLKALSFKSLAAVKYYEILFSLIMNLASESDELYQTSHTFRQKFLKYKTKYSALRRLLSQNPMF